MCVVYFDQRVSASHLICLLVKICFFTFFVFPLFPYFEMKKGEMRPKRKKTIVVSIGSLTAFMSFSLQWNKNDKKSKLYKETIIYKGRTK